MNRNIRFGLKQKLIASFSIFTVLVGVGISTFSISSFTNMIMEKNFLYINDITYQVSGNVQLHTELMEDITFSILSSSAVQTNLRTLNSKDVTDAEAAMAAKNIMNVMDLHTLYNDYIISMRVLSGSGHDIVSGAFRLEPIKLLFGKDELDMAGGSALWGIISDEDNSLCVARSILDLKTQKPIGQVHLIFRQSYIGEIMNDISISYQNGSYLLNEDSTVISSNLPTFIGGNLEFGEPKLLEDKVIKATVAGVPSYVYFGSKMKNGWILATTIPVSELAGEIASLRGFSILVDVVVIAAAVVTIWLIVRRITSPIEKLCSNMKEVGQGNFEKRAVIDTKDEIGMLSESYNDMVDNIESLIEHVYILEIHNKQAELEFLKMQINPHFLYNTLDTISWMARIEKQEDISEMTIALASLLRNNLKQDSRVTIRMEMENICNYLLIQKFRFGEKLIWRLVVEPQCEDYYIPGFILQPLVENAIIHGLEPKQGKGRLMLSIKEEGDKVNFVVADDGVGMAQNKLEILKLDIQDASSKQCIGLKNADRRLRLQYDDSAALCIESNVEIGTRVSFSIPANQSKHGG